MQHLDHMNIVVMSVFKFSLNVEVMDVIMCDECMSLKVSQNNNKSRSYSLKMKLIQLVTNKLGKMFLVIEL